MSNGVGGSNMQIELNQPVDISSNELMIIVPGEFGIRYEDHFYMTETGPRWFTQPMLSIDDPFTL